MASTRSVTVEVAVQLSIEERTKQALIALGWTPPESLTLDESADAIASMGSILARDEEEGR